MAKTKLCNTLADLKAEYLGEQGKEKVRFRLWGKPQTNTLALYLLEYDPKKRKNNYYRLDKLNLNIETSMEVRTLNRKVWEAAVKARNDANAEVLDTMSGKMKKSHRILLSEYLDDIVREKKAKSASIRCLQSIVKHLECYGGKDVTLADVDFDFVDGWLDYLNNEARTWSWKTGHVVKNKRYHDLVLKPLSPGTKRVMWQIFSSCMDRAVREKLISANPCKTIDSSYKPRDFSMESKIKYLEKDDLAKLMEAPCRNPDVKNAFLFSCFTGLRWSDVGRITWKNFWTNSEGQMMLSFVMKKVKRSLTIPVPDFVLQYIPAKGSIPDDQPLFNLHSNTYTNKNLKSWAKTAGISQQNLTFHMARHTSATFSMSVAGVPMEVVSKLLGHTKISTTEIYAKVLDQRKAEAGIKINETLNNLFK